MFSPRTVLAVCICTTTALLALASPALGALPPFHSKFGTFGVVNGQFNAPFGVATSPGGDIYVSDQGNDRVQRFSSGETFLGKWGSAGSAHGQFNTVDGVATDSSGNVYTAECGNNRVQKFAPDGTFITAFGRNGGDGSSGTGNGEFECVVSVAIDSANGNIVAADAINNRVQVLSPTGSFIRKWGKKGGAGGDNSDGTGNGEFADPQGIAISPTGHVYVVEYTNNRVQEFTADGTFVRKWGRNGGAGGGDSPGAGPGEFNDPEGAAVDRTGNVWVADDSNDRLQEFTPEGALVGAYGTSGAADGQFDAPTAVAFDCHGNAYVADYGNNRIDRFGDPGVGAGACTPPSLTSGAASNVDATSATLAASVNPNGTLAVGRFDYGLSTAYGSQTADQNFGFGTTATPQTAKLTGLAPGKTHHYRVAGSGAFGAASGADQAFTTLNRIDSFAVSRSKFAVGPGKTALGAKRAKKGTTFSYALAAAGSASIRIDQLVKARRSKGKCRKNAKKGKRCTLTVKKGTLKRNAKAAQNKLKFSGRLGRKKLKPGSYTATITATATGTTTPSTGKTLRFKIVRR